MSYTMTIIMWILPLSEATSDFVVRLSGYQVIKTTRQKKPLPIIGRGENLKSIMQKFLTQRKSRCVVLYVSCGDDELVIAVGELV